MRRALRWAMGSLTCKMNLFAAVEFLRDGVCNIPESRPEEIDTFEHRKSETVFEDFVHKSFSDGQQAVLRQELFYISYPWYKWTSNVTPW